MKKKAWIGAGLVAILIILVIIGIGIRNRKGASSRIPYATAKVERGNVVISVSATGTVDPVSKVEVKSKASGEIIALPVEAGDRIKKGALIAKVDPTDVKNQYDQAKADLDVAVVARKQAELDLKRQRELFDKGLSSDKDLETAQMAAEKAKADEVRARVALNLGSERLKDTVLRSPMDGIVLTKDVDKGQIISSGISSVSGGTTIATIADLSLVYIRSDVDETDIGRVKKGQTVRITPEAYPDSVLEGNVESIAPQSKTVQNVTTFEVTCKVENRSGLLFSGMNVNTDIVSEERNSVLTVPLGAVKDFSELRTLGPKLGLKRPNRPEGGAAEARVPREGQDRSRRPTGKVVLVKANGRIEPRRVETGLKNWDLCEITSGLAEGEEVLVIRSEAGSRGGDRFTRQMQRMGGIPGLRRQ